ncbi:hypothetical protein N9T26_00155 [Alphaproteobacteria bacterium]|nr:hypothetical protein [Alphaproteobacteria bacterium]
MVYLRRAQLWFVTAGIIVNALCFFSTSNALADTTTLLCVDKDHRVEKMLFDGDTLKRAGGQMAWKKIRKIRSEDGRTEYSYYLSNSSKVPEWMGLVELQELQGSTDFYVTLANPNLKFIAEYRCRRI